jgi:pimeloyl-ACP methyl ester carboxylesterase
MLTALMFAALVLGPPRTVAVAPGAGIDTYDCGAGPTVVLVPGLTGCAWGFRHLVPLLADHGCRVVIVEPLGISGSDRPRGADYSLTAQAQRIAAALDSLGTGPALLVGHGVSGSMVLRAACSRPDLAAGVVLLEGSADDQAVTPAVAGTLKLAGIASRLGGARLLRDRLEEGMRAASGNDTWLDGITVRRYFAGAARDLPATIDALKAMAAADEPQRLAPRLGQIACPVTLVLGGAPHEGAPDAADIAALQTGLPDLRLMTIPDCGHYLFEENPGATAAAILAAVTVPRLALLPAETSRSAP